MVKEALTKNTFREIKQSFGRFLAILAIVALGVGFYAGLSVTKEAMVRTGDEYFRENALFDLRLISTLGLYDEDVDEIKKLDFVTEAEGAYSTDALVTIGNSGSAVKFLSLSDTINRVIVTEGRLPENPGECLVDDFFSGDLIGKTILLSDGNKQDTLDMFKNKEFTVTGRCKAVAYVNYERGNTTLGDGTLSGFVYVAPSEFDTEYFTEIYAVTKASSLRIYSDAYKDEMDIEEEKAEDLLTKLAHDRYTDLKTEADDKIADAEREIADAETKIADGEEKLADGKKEIEENEQKIADAEKEISDGEKKLADGRKELDRAEKELNDAKAFLPPAMYDAQLSEIKKARKELKNKEKEIEDARADIEDARVKIEDAKKEIAEHEAEIADAKIEVVDGKEKLEDAKEKLKDLKEPDVYVLTRSTNIGYVCFDNDSSIVEGLADVFPLFFFLVAALVCMTTMNRMVEEQRTQIGVMKALGYAERSIMGKYLFYSGSAAMVGCIIGFLGGSYIFPAVIWTAYDIMYNMKPIVFVFDVKYAIISVVVSIICSMGATYATLHGELRSQAADLIRPKAPASGKRVFLEKIGFFWKRLSFTGKVSVRNVFRYKKRFFMMILGVGGCYALLLTGLGINDSITGITDSQFKKIQNIDITVNFGDSVSEEDFDKFEGVLSPGDKYLYARVKTVDTVFDGKQKSTILSVSSGGSDGVTMSDFMNYMDVKENPISLPGYGEVVISSPMAGDLGIEVGDDIVLRDPDLKEIKVRVSGIMLNYVNHLAYITEETYVDAMKEDFRVNTAYLRTNEDVYATGAAVSDLECVTSVSITDEMVRRVDKMLESMKYVVWLTIVSAAALAFIVMYNLTNINITERIREIATLKVLGFYPKETNIYVFRENFVLTAIGIVAGVFMGIGLHWYVMRNIRVDLVSFDVKILPVSFIMAVLLTFLYAIFVDVVLSGKLERIHMAESLKSVE
ncbi:MAG: FtsX-like permease family protein [Lachnospiraceae bacterium]|nr:FtsX-like permease family protein [Lachnospiraceae bacterium]